MRVLVVNPGSSSLKLRVLDGADEIVAARDSPPIAEGAATASDLLVGLPPFDAIGLRVVHGGERFSSSVLVDDEVRDALAALVDLAPLHQPLALAALAALRSAGVDRPVVACFDTAFHSTLDTAAATYALPEQWRARHGVKRYGFHGLSHAYASRRAAELVGRPASDLRIVTCHLGAGASLAAVRDAVSVDTTMGFTPLAGLVMATRSGDVDPGAVLWLLRDAGIPMEEVAHALEHESGLLGLAGTADMREVVASAENGDDRARLALDVYVHRLCAGIASMAASLGGLDVLVFTGGVGEGSPEVRALATERLGFLGVRLDEEANRRAVPDAEIGGRDAPVRTLAIAAREDLEIAREVRELVSEDS